MAFGDIDRFTPEEELQLLLDVDEAALASEAPNTRATRLGGVEPEPRLDLDLGLALYNAVVRNPGATTSILRILASDTSFRVSAVQYQQLAAAALAEGRHPDSVTLAEVVERLDSAEASTQPDAEVATLMSEPEPPAISEEVETGVTDPIGWLAGVLPDRAGQQATTTNLPSSGELSGDSACTAAPAVESLAQRISRLLRGR